MDAPDHPNKPPGISGRAFVVSLVAAVLAALVAFSVVIYNRPARIENSFAKLTFTGGLSRLETAARIERHVAAGALPADPDRLRAEWHAAEERFSQSLDTRLAPAQAHGWRGETRLKQGAWDAAAEDFTAALLAAGENPDPADLSGRGLAELRRGDPAAAARDFDAALRRIDAGAETRFGGTLDFPARDRGEVERLRADADLSRHPRRDG